MPAGGSDGRSVARQAIRRACGSVPCVPGDQMVSVADRTGARVSDAANHDTGAISAMPSGGRLVHFRVSGWSDMALVLPGSSRKDTAHATPHAPDSEQAP